MTREEFLQNYKEFAVKAYRMSEKSRREGLLSLEDEIDDKEVENRDIFHYGLMFVVDGFDSSILDKLLTNIISFEKDPYTIMYKNIQKAAVLSIQAGDNPRILYYVLNSYTDLKLNEDTPLKELEMYAEDEDLNSDDDSDELD